MVRLLLSAGADINLATYSGRTVQSLAQTPSMKEFIAGWVGSSISIQCQFTEVAMNNYQIT